MSSTRNATDNHKQLRMDPDDAFRFNCSSGAACFTRCCQDVTIVLSPYDVLRLKNALGMSSGDFLEKHTIIIQKKDRLIPMVVLKMNEQDKRCPFVSKDGCAVYNDRPWPCRLFPLDMNDDGTFAMETNVPNLVMGYGMLEFAKGGIVNHIAKLQQKNNNIVKPNGILNFARNLKR